MTHLSDSRYVKEQYGESANLEARISLHRRFSRNPYRWLRWVFDQLSLPPAARILELGCGPGNLWQENRERLNQSWRITLSDASFGMVSTARSELKALEQHLTFAQIDAQQLPFGDAEFDAVIANHMLYHLSDRQSALSEMRRVLRPGGRLYTTTIGATHMAELNELAAGFDPDLEDSVSNRELGFTLENGAAQLAAWFKRIEMRSYPDGLEVTDAGALAGYIVSGLRWPMPAERRAGLEQWIQGKLERSGGVIRISKDSGMFIAAD